MTKKTEAITNSKGTIKLFPVPKRDRDAGASKAPGPSRDDGGRRTFPGAPQKNGSRPAPKRSARGR